MHNLYVYMKVVLVLAVLNAVYIIFFSSFQARERRRQDQLSNPHYLKPSSSNSPSLRREEEVEVGKPATATSTKDIPVSKLELGIPLLIGQLNITKFMFIHILYSSLGIHRV